MTACPCCGHELKDEASCPRCGRENGGSLAATLASPPERLANRAPPAMLRPGAMLGRRYRIIDRVGAGGMGEVYRAEDLELRESVALKLLPAAVAADADRRERLRQEVSLSRRVSHPNVCRVHDLGDADGRLFLSMEYVDGEDLASLLARIGRLTADKALAIARQVTGGLAAAHAAGVLHRDLKPANVMLDRKGNARLTDFGLAVAGASAASGELAGTPRYMAPEQLAGRPASERTDVYALGLLLYELLTGVPVYDGRTFEELRRAREVPPARPSTIIGDLDQRIEEVILRCLAHDEASRPASALAVLTVLSGGDALQAALAAGQTPSPSTVAGALESGTLRPAAAWACLGIIAAAMIFYQTGAQRLSLLEGSRMELPPEALAVRARTVLAELGYPGPWNDQAWGFAWDSAALRHIEAHGGWDALAAARPPVIVFWYRGAAEAMTPPATTGRISEREPPLGPGMVAVRLDPKGRLLRLAARPDGKPLDPPTPGEALLAAAGVAADGLRTTEARRSAAFSDSRLAWEREADGLRLDVALLDGRPVEAELSGPWSEACSFPGSRGGGFAALWLIALLASLALARANLRQGRGDMKGALRVAAAVFVLYLGGRLLRSHDAVVVNAVLLLAAAERALALAAKAGLFYLALEPWVRRVWPQRLVSWARLLEGRWRDPMVARDVLVGLAVAWGSAAAVAASFVVGPGQPTMNPVLYGLDPLLGNRFIVAALLWATADAVSAGLLALVLLLLLRYLPIREWLGSSLLATVLATTIWYAVWGGATARASLIVALLALVIAASWVALLTRVGLLAMISGAMAELFGGAMPNAMRLQGWTSAPAWATLLVTLGLALYGARFAVGGRRLLRLGAPDGQPER